MTTQETAELWIIPSVSGSNADAELQELLHSIRSDKSGKPRSWVKSAQIIDGLIQVTANPGTTGRQARITLQRILKDTDAEITPIRPNTITGETPLPEQIFWIQSRDASQLVLSFGLPLSPSTQNDIANNLLDIKPETDVHWLSPYALVIFGTPEHQRQFIQPVIDSITRLGHHFREDLGMPLGRITLATVRAVEVTPASVTLILEPELSPVNRSQADHALRHADLDIHWSDNNRTVRVKRHLGLLKDVWRELADLGYRYDTNRSAHIDGFDPAALSAGPAVNVYLVLSSGTSSRVRFFVPAATNITQHQLLMKLGGLGFEHHVQSDTLEGFGPGSIISVIYERDEDEHQRQIGLIHGMLAELGLQPLGTLTHGDRLQTVIHRLSTVAGSVSGHYTMEITPQTITVSVPNIPDHTAESGKPLRNL